MSDTVCPSCGNWRAHDGFGGNHNPDCPLIERWAATGAIVLGADGVTLKCHIDGATRETDESLARRVAAALNGTPDLTALADALAEYDRLHDNFMAYSGSDIERIVDVTTPLPPAKDAVIAAARALVASTGTETGQ